MDSRMTMIYEALGNNNWSNFVNLYCKNQEIFAQEYIPLHSSHHSVSLYADGRAMVFNHNNGELLYGIWFTLDDFNMVVVK